jgi:hypothetical protein
MIVPYLFNALRPKIVCPRKSNNARALQDGPDGLDLLHADEFLFQAAMEETQVVGIQTHEVQDRRVEILHV